MQNLNTNDYLKLFPNTFLIGYDDSKKTNHIKTYGHKYNLEDLKKNNELGFSVHATVNGFESSRKEGTEVYFQGCYGDLDFGKKIRGEPQQPLEEIKPLKEKVFQDFQKITNPPNIITVTRNGLQPIWLIEPLSPDECKLSDYKLINDGIRDWMNANFDAKADSISDSTRVLRVPGFYHMFGEPFLIESFLLHEQRYILDDLRRAFPNKVMDEPQNLYIPKDAYQESIYSYPVKEALIKLSGHSIVNGERYEFRPGSDGNLNIWVNGQSTANFINVLENTLGRAGGGASVNIVDWCNYCVKGNKEEIRKTLDILLLGKIYSEAGKITQKNAGNYSKRYNLTDNGNAEMIADLFGEKIRYDHLRNRWLLWYGHRWVLDEDGEVQRLAIKTAKQRFKDASNINNLTDKSLASKWSIASESQQKVNAALGLAKTTRPIADNGKSWDTNIWLLCCNNGVIDLKTGVLRPGRPEDRISMSTRIDFDPRAKCPRFEKFISEVFSDPIIERYVQKALGYSITGDNSEQVIFFGYGSGANGKSTLFNAIRSAIGDYSYQAPKSMFIKSTSTSTNDMAAAENKRFLVSSETLTTSKLDEQALKTWSGGDSVKARFLYQEYFEFKPQAKIWLFLNHKPKVDDDSHAFWRRVRFIPFTRSFKGLKADLNLENTLKAEAQGILNWLVQGSLLWQSEGLKPVPEIIMAAGEAYRAENDPLYDFFCECCEEGEDLEVQSTKLYSSYSVWCDLNRLRGRDILSQTIFGRIVSDRFKKVRKTNGIYYRGVGCRVEDNSTSGDVGFKPIFRKLSI